MNNLSRPVLSRFLMPSIVVFGLSIFAFVAAFDIRTPGLYYDEALFVNSASGGVTDLFVYKRIAGIPVMLMPYIGALKSWLYVPIFKLFGIDLFTIRLPAVLLGALALGLTWRYVQQQFGAMAAAFFLFMAAVEPGTVFHSRLDWGPTALMMVFRAGLLLSLTNWFVTEKKRYLLWALICAGLGVFDKLNFVWIVTSCFAAGLLVYPERFLFGRAIKVKKVLIWLGLGLCTLGLLTTALSALGVSLTQEVGVQNVGERSITFLHLLGLTIRGEGVYSFVVQGGQQAFDVQVYALITVSSFAMWGLVAGIRSGKLSARGMVYLALVMLLLGGQIFFTRQATGPHHFATIAPLWLIFIAVGLSGAVYSIKERSPALAQAFGVLSVAAVMATSLRCDWEYLEGFKKTQINPFWDQASSTVLTSALESEMDAVTTVVAVDWGIATNVQALSNNRLKVMELWPMFNEKLSKDELSWIRTEFVDQGAAFVLHVNGREAFPSTRTNFLDAIQDEGWPVRRALTIKTTDGEPFIEVYLPISVSTR